jgi:ribosomal protein L19
MPISFRTVGSGLLALIVLASAAFSQPPASPPRINAGETVNVEVKIVPGRTRSSSAWAGRRCRSSRSTVT